MRSPHSFLVNPVGDKRYDNVRNGLIISSSKEDHTASNRFAVVVNTPTWYKGNIVPGDILVVHHNVFKYYNDMKGKERSGKSFVSNNLFTVDPEQYYMYKHDEKWICDGRYSFVRPILADNSVIQKGTMYEPLVAEMVYPSKYAEHHGIIAGSKIGFEPDADYEFNIDGEKLYRIIDTHLSIHYEN